MEILIMSGPPGSGKSFYTKRLKEQGRKIIICSADHHFIDEKTDIYNFKPSEIGEAHKRCYRKFLKEAYDGAHDCGAPDYLIVDNTNTQLWEITPYTMVATAYDIPFKVVRFMTDPEVCAARNVHGVPADKVREMAERASKLSIPRYWNVEIVR